MFSLAVRVARVSVLKTGRPVQPVGPSTGPLSGSVPPNNRFVTKTGLESENRSRPVVERPARENRYWVGQPRP